MDGYLVQQPFADLIAQGRKAWDVRTAKVHLPRGRFLILATTRPHPSAGSYPEHRLGRAVATARCAEVIGPLSIDAMLMHHDKHLIDEPVLRAYSRGRDLYAMVLADVQAIKDPPTYEGKPGAVTLIRDVSLGSTRPAW
jgi:hypothetical protein